MQGINKKKPSQLFILFWLMCWLYCEKTRANDACHDCGQLFWSLAHFEHSPIISCNKDELDPKTPICNCITDSRDDRIELDYYCHTCFIKHFYIVKGPPPNNPLKKVPIQTARKYAPSTKTKSARI
jgi:hypothetical protein